MMKATKNENSKTIFQTPASGYPGIVDDLIFSGAGSGCRGDDEDECTPPFDSGSGDDLITPVYVPPTKQPTTPQKETGGTERTCDDEDCIHGSGDSFEGTETITSTTSKGTGILSYAPLYFLLVSKLRAALFLQIPPSTFLSYRIQLVIPMVRLRLNMKQLAQQLRLVAQLVSEQLHRLVRRRVAQRHSTQARERHNGQQHSTFKLLNLTVRQRNITARHRLQQIWSMKWMKMNWTIDSATSTSMSMNMSTSTSIRKYNIRIFQCLSQNQSRHIIIYHRQRIIHGPRARILVESHPKKKNELL